MFGIIFIYNFLLKMKNTIIGLLFICLVGTFVSFQKPNPQQFMIVAEYSQTDNDYVCYWWKENSTQGIKLVGVYEIIKYANASGHKITTSFPIESSYRTWPVHKIFFILE